LASSPIPFAPADVAWTMQQSGGWPFLLQILAHERLLTLAEGEIGGYRFQLELIRRWFAC
jgi:hypothetical protein